MVEPPVVRGEDEDPPGTEVASRVERELEVGRVLLDRMSFDARAGPHRLVYRSRRDRVKVSDQQVDPETECPRVLEPSVGRDHACVERDREHSLRGGRAPAGDHDHDFVRHDFLRWNYPDQVLRVGGALRPPSQPGCPELPYAAPIVAPEAFVADLAVARIGATFNQYALGPRARLLRERLVRYLQARAGTRVVLIGEAAGYRGARVSGIPFTSERQLTGSGPAEATATIVHGVLAELDLDDRVLLWNAVPTHPGTETSNRPPSLAEIRGGLRFAEQIVAGREAVAVGRTAERALGIAGVRHPAHGGALAFRNGLHELLARAL
jgi:hypothetical protein